MPFSTAFSSPHRLLWPKAKSLDDFYAEGEKLLENFPAQATISPYEASGSDDEEEEEREEEVAAAAAMGATPLPPGPGSSCLSSPA